MVPAYLTALLVGVAIVLLAFPHWALTGRLPPGAPPEPDFAQHAIGQIYFFAQPWEFSFRSLRTLLVARGLDAPRGVNIALADSIPLLTILSKLLRPLLPPFEQTITVYQAAAWVMQPIAGVFALRSTGERRWLPGLAVALMAASMPTFLFRLWHAALSGHWMLLVALGLYFRIVRGSRAATVAGCVLPVVLLLIHPYLMLMASWVLLAAPLTLLLRHDPRWRGPLAAWAASSALVLLVGQVLGYWGQGSDGGYGFYSMNLAGPFWPTLSGLFPGISYTPADGTGGQAEGYQYLGLGLLGLIAVSLAGCRHWPQTVRRHPGLLIACVTLAMVAVTNWIFFLHTRLLHIPFPSLLFAQLRGSGRLFWPVSYVLLIGSILAVLRLLPRAGILLVLAAALLQVADAGELRRVDHNSLAEPVAYPFDQPRLSAILRAHAALTVLPTFPCNGGGLAPNLDVLWLAAQSHLAIASMYSARTSRQQACVPEAALQSRPAAGEVRVVMPGFDRLAAALPYSQTDCRVLAPFIVCSRRSSLLDGLPPVDLRTLPMSRILPTRAGQAGADALLSGWTTPVPGAPGLWSNAPSALLGGRLQPEPTGPVRIRIRAFAMPTRIWLGLASPRRAVSVWAGERKIADWSLGRKPGQFEAVVPADWIRQQHAVIVELRTGPLASMLDLGHTPDPRRFGIWLSSVEFVPG
ncbi:DUF6311 domain-containing protein [Lichenicoccus sp.]|uniref:DUF6311 domain-containing protein n=1 Tax=Lichenicoccus sp. TaxID=2781899 RepID=UPI003D0ABCA1